MNILEITREKCAQTLKILTVWIEFLDSVFAGILSYIIIHNGESDVSWKGLVCCGLNASLLWVVKSLILVYFEIDLSLWNL